MNKDFISSNRNDSFVLLRGLDLQDLLIQTKHFLLEYRSQLDLSDDLTFGIEIEYEGIPKIMVDNFIKKNLNNWASEADGSLKSGGEIKSPIMCDNIKYWEELKRICDYLTKRKADTSHNAGGHIHIGAHMLGDDVKAWQHFLKLYIAYENVLFRFIYGDKISGRTQIFKYAPPIAHILHRNLIHINGAKTIDDIWQILPIVKYQALNFGHVNFSSLEDICYKNTIELRCPNATTNATIWQNNINAFSKMIICSKNKVMDEEFLDYKLNNEFYPYPYYEYLYNNINLKNVLEFVDLVFDNNLDKVYFLRQYLKDFQDNYNIKEAISAKRFVK